RNSWITRKPEVNFFNQAIALIDSCQQMDWGYDENLHVSSVVRVSSTRTHSQIEAIANLNPLF
ncbi:MAG: hypothetical protein DMG82_14380, partial [Acidobacteria bacterium]